MKKNLFALSILGFALFSCSENRKKINEQVVGPAQIDSATVVSTSPNVAFFQYDELPDYPDAVLELFTPLGNQVFKPGKVPFEFNIKNYPFEEEASNQFKLFMVLNNNDPIGYRSPIFQQELEEGTYRVVAFLVDEAGFALKNFGNYVDRDFQVGDSRPFPYSAEPYLAVNYPRNQELIEEGEELVVDFLVLGGDMKLDDLQVKIEVGDYHYEIDHMAPVRVDNLPSGEYQVKISLLRKDGTELEGPFSSVSKTVLVR
ncbi:hypothetical protein [Algoriphagus limi]|uniref:Uncharacterized protein n=1 Tax=Algoriphagus limi TaxID=2975273 RepID=A0ABT2GA03_9BACT|nr:hypothetical protein [Algoriphagus limi]MCS5491271.1 hypothetical protein [Algoriphagus limi]